MHNTSRVPLPCTFIRASNAFPRLWARALIHRAGRRTVRRPESAAGEAAAGVRHRPSFKGLIRAPIIPILKP